MNHIFESEKRILRALMKRPALLEKTPDLCVNAFSRVDHKRIFAVIAELWEDRKPDSIDESELAKKAGLALEELRSITNGSYCDTPEHFLNLVSNLLATKAQGSVQMSEVESEPISWLWPNYFPISKINLISGDPGAGKTWFCLDLVARLSTGREWPDGSPGSDSGNSLILSCEDGAADTLRPRLDKLKADTTKIFLLQNPLDLSSRAGRAVFISEIEYRNPKLIIIDPILDFSGRVNPNAVDQVRAMLTPLSEIAERNKAAILLTSHLNKSSVMQAIYRTAGSASGWVGKARAVFLITKYKEDSEENGQSRRIFAPIKTNLSPVEPQAFFFLISDNPGLVYERAPKEFNLDDVLSSDHKENAPQLEKAKTFLREFLKAGPMPASNIMRQAQEAGIRKKTLYRANEALGITTFHEGGTHGRWIWGMEK